MTYRRWQMIEYECGASMEWYRQGKNQGTRYSERNLTHCHFAKHVSDRAVLVSNPGLRGEKLSCVIV